MRKSPDNRKVPQAERPPRPDAEKGVDRVITRGDYTDLPLDTIDAAADYITFVDDTDGEMKRGLPPAGGGANTIRVFEAGSSVGNRPILNFTESGTINLTITDDLPNTRVNINIGTVTPATLAALEATALAIDKLPYYDSGSTAATTDLTSFARTLLDDATAAAARATLEITGAAGVSDVDFGAFPGASDTSVAVTGQPGILSGSVLQAWLYPLATADHSADEHRIETISVSAGDIVAATGFTIWAQNTSQLNEPLTVNRVGAVVTKAATSAYGNSGPTVGGQGTRLYGRYSVAWRWS